MNDEGEPTMRRWVLRAGGTSIDDLELQRVPVPSPGPGQVRVTVRAASLNFRDRAFVAGQYGPVPDVDTVPLSDCAGVVDAVGEGAMPWSLGDRVTSVYYPRWRDGPQPDGLGLGPGTAGDPGMLAEHIVLDADALTAAPATLTDVEASTLVCAGVTAWSALNGSERPYGTHQLRRNDKVLVLGSGGVALLALVLARALGAEVIATSGTEEKAAEVRSLGATFAVNYSTDGDWGRTVFERTGGVDRVVNPVGGAAMDQAFLALGNGGEVALMGFIAAATTPPDLNMLMSKTGSLRGTRVGSVAAHNDLVAAVDRLGVKPLVHRVYPFEEAREAFRDASGRDVFGKVVVEVLPEEP